MEPARIAELLAPFLAEPLSARQLEHISTYIDMLRRWNARINLTAIRNEEEIVTRHFGESLFVARILFPDLLACSASAAVKTFDVAQSRDSGELSGPSTNRGRAALAGPRSSSISGGALAPTVADVGSGAGFPGIPIKLWAPEISLTLIESNHKKATFLHEVARALTLTDVNIRNTRAEELPAASFDVVTLRAVERFESILPVAARLVGPRGRLALLIGQAQYPQAKSVLPSWTWKSAIAIPHSQSRVILLGTAS